MLANNLAWKMLHQKHPSKFFQGCASHGLNLFVKDIFSPSKTKKNGQADATYPEEYPFEYLLKLLEDCKYVVHSFHISHILNYEVVFDWHTVTIVLNKQYHLNLYIDIFLRSFLSKHGVQIMAIQRSIFDDYVREIFKCNDLYEMHNYIDNLFFDYSTFLLFCQCTFPCPFPW